tara:strand:- start:44 stop:211 length:168 start_codon:yes stop_codon:yes gene_type:complete
MLSRLFLIKNKKCCGNGCFMCPYSPKHEKSSYLLREDVLKNLNKDEYIIINKGKN